MRIISGEFRRRRLQGPPDANTTRPIPDLVKQALFNLLRGYTEGAAVFDAFAGTGSIGLEAVSQGAKKCVFVERDKKIGEILEANIATVGAGDRCSIVRADALGPMALARCPMPVDLVFMDPPYPIVREAEGWGRVKAQAEKLVARLSDEGWLVLRTPWPFVHEVKTEGDDRDGDEREPEDAVIEIDLDDEAALDDLDAFEEELRAAARVASGKTYEEVGLTLEGALGPETHVYRATAIHLYQRDRGGPDGRGEPTGTPADGAES